jgi:hypothetical protein
MPGAGMRHSHWRRQAASGASARCGSVVDAIEQLDALRRELRVHPRREVVVFGRPVEASARFPPGS